MHLICTTPHDNNLLYPGKCLYSSCCQFSMCMYRMYSGNLKVQICSLQNNKQLFLSSIIPIMHQKTGSSLTTARTPSSHWIIVSIWSCLTNKGAAPNDEKKDELEGSLCVQLTYIVPTCIIYVCSINSIRNNQQQQSTVVAEDVCCLCLA